MPITYVDTRQPAKYPGHPPKTYEFKPTTITEMVNEMLRTDRSNRRNLILQMLYEFISLTELTLYVLVHEQVSISDNVNTFLRELRRYRSKGLIINVPFGIKKAAVRAGLPQPKDRSLHAYCLGPVGEEYVRRKGWHNDLPPQNMTEDYMAHDLICAEAMLKMRALWKEHATNPGWVEVRGPREVSLWDAEKKVYILAPDGLLIKRNQNGDIERAFVVEYQNVRNVLQVKNKLAKYEQLSGPKYDWIWSSWGLNEMPWILIVHRQGSTLHHYQEEIAQLGEMTARFASLALEDVWAGRLFIKPLHGNR